MNNYNLATYIADQIIQGCINLFLILVILGFVLGYAVIGFREGFVSRGIKETHPVVRTQVPQMERLVHSTKDGQR